MHTSVFVTGASGNLGQAIAKKFLGEGLAVVGTYLPHTPKQALEDEAHFTRISLNLLKESDVQSAFDSLTANGAQIDTAIFTVGGFAMGKLEETGEAELEKMFKLNLYTAFFGVKAAVAHMKAHGKGGHVFLVASRQGVHPEQGTHTVAYTLSKSAVLALAAIINAEQNQTGITAHVIVPGILDTPQNRAAMPDADPSKWVTPENVAEVVHFHCSDKAINLREPIIKIYGQS